MRAIVSVFVLVVFSGSVQAQPGAAPPAGPADPTAAPAPGPPPMGPPAEPYPGQMQPYPPQPYPQPYPGQPYPAQPPYPYPPVQLTPEEQQLLAEGEISLGQHAGGVAANWLLGFGIGQAIQGRWSETGWMFTLGEAAGISLMVAGAVRSCFGCEGNDDDGATLLIGGLIGYMAFHIWSIVDAATGPAGHNRKVRELRHRIGMPMHASQRVLPYVAPARDGSGGGGTVGLTLRF